MITPVPFMPRRLTLTVGTTPAGLEHRSSPDGLSSRHLSTCHLLKTAPIGANSADPVGPKHQFFPKIYIIANCHPLICLNRNLTQALKSAIINYRAGQMTPSNIQSGITGAVSERLKEAVLKTVVPKGTGGSNPPCSVRYIKVPKKFPVYGKMLQVTGSSGDSKRSVAVKISRRKPCYRKSGAGRAGQRAGGLEARNRMTLHRRMAVQ